MKLGIELQPQLLMRQLYLHIPLHPLLILVVSSLCHGEHLGLFSVELQEVRQFVFDDEGVIGVFFLLALVC